ncbi:LytR cell envelope-related transcriptional attenuator [Haloactinopolyspora alba]|uniref:LytR cell envelope-related transcriptional attenuator n=1 Tax=Haloactinopolyspora alba TaxID=648780 RepID=A0A2P8E778_9ACTN|nr:LytR C-terminal domain-containing protein [Haloactinopolyspora alba]PSL05334.1 LytR cell envelope-related transcriptional attenuator [Haloactinopolyspora alba]
MAPDEQAVDPAARRRRWKRIRTSVTLLVLIGFVVGAASYSWRNVVEADDEESTVSASGGCAPAAPTAAPKPAEVEINVYNSTDRNNLASDVAGRMQDRGFVVLDIANDPLDKSIDRTAEVRASPDNRAAARLVASMVPGAAFVADERSEATVDLVLGSAFKSLANPSAGGGRPKDLPPCEPSPSG